MSQNSSTYIIGDVRDCLAAIPDGSIDLVMTSPPFLALRSYLPADHPDKYREIGSEPDPATFLDTLLLLTAEWGRVLAPHGSICVELGDTYAGSGGGGGDYADGGVRENQPKFRAGTPRWDGRPNGQVRTTTSDPVSYPSRARNGWPLPKSLCGIPHLYHLSLAYGRNLLTGEESPAGRWRVRNVVAWCRPNPPVGALGDKFRPATSYMTIATRAQKRYFDLDAVRDGNYQPRSTMGKVDARNTERAKVGLSSGNPGKDNNPAGAPPLDYWVIPTQPYSGSHYATFPASLCERPIKAMCPAKVCTVCGKPSERITSEPECVDQRGAPHDGDAEWRHGRGGAEEGMGSTAPTSLTRTTTTIGWSECECPDDGTKWRPGVVLDPFAGSGTTLMVANELERDAIGFDLDERNASLARDRVDKFLFSDFRA